MMMSIQNISAKTKFENGVRRLKTKESVTLVLRDEYDSDIEIVTSCLFCCYLSEKTAMVLVIRIKSQ